MTNEEIAWLAGWLEGEGTFYFTDYMRKRTTPKLVIQVFSTDRDVIEKAAKLVDGHIYNVVPRQHPDGWNSAPGWRLSLERKPAYDLMKQILPFMGIRRSEQIRKAMESWENRRNKPIEKFCACGCGRKVFGGPRVLYARGNKDGGACAQNAYRQRQKKAINDLSHEVPFPDKPEMIQ